MTRELALLMAFASIAAGSRHSFSSIEILRRNIALSISSRSTCQKIAAPAQSPTAAFAGIGRPLVDASANRDATSYISRSSLFPFRSRMASTSSGADISKKKRKRRGINSRQRLSNEREFVGRAKAVDRGQYDITYSMENVQALSGLPDMSKPFTVLGIESSCDDTGAAVVRSDGTILGESLASQHTIHERFGGVVPGLARDAHVAAIDGVVDGALRAAGLTMADVDAIGATVGPGLEICLRVGCDAGTELAVRYGKPFVGVHHLEAHVLMARMPIGREGDRALEFPFLALLVSGGHCLLLKCLGVGKYTVMGGTLDDSLGEAYDKSARLLALDLSKGGGPAIEALALDGDPKSIKLTIPMSQRKDCDFSFAGLKNAFRMAVNKLRVERELDENDELSHSDKANLAASFQHIAIRHLEQRLERAMSRCEDDGIRTLAVVGGVAANQELRSRLRRLCENRVPESGGDKKWSMFVPPPGLCTDQGAMSAWAAVERLSLGSSDEPKGHQVYARYPFASGMMP